MLIMDILLNLSGGLFQGRRYRASNAGNDCALSAWCSIIQWWLRRRPHGCSVHCFKYSRKQ